MEVQGSSPARGLSRRALLGSGAALGLGTMLGLELFEAPAAHAAPPTSAAGVIALGRSYMGMGLQAIRPLTESPWSGYADADWCAWFVSWISRGLGSGYHTWANSWDYLPSPPPNQAQVGDFARIGTASSAIHIGIVTEVAPNGTVTKILDGNRIRKPATNWSNSFVREEGPYAPYVLRRPTYSGSGGDMPTPFATGNSTPIQLTQMTWANVEQYAGTQWPKLPYTGTATNIAELVPTAILFDVAVGLYVSNLPAGDHVGVRIATWHKTTNVISGLASMTFEGDSTGRARGRYVGRTSIDQSTHRLCVQAYSTAPAAILNWWGVDGFAW